MIVCVGRNVQLQLFSLQVPMLAFWLGSLVWFCCSNECLWIGWFGDNQCGLDSGELDVSCYSYFAEELVTHIYGLQPEAAGKNTDT